MVQNQHAILQRLNEARQEHRPLPQEVETDLRENLGNFLDIVLANFKDNLPATLAERDDLLKAVDQRLVFVKEEDIKRIAQEFDLEITPHTAGFFTTDGNGPLVIGVPNEEKIAQVLKHSSSETGALLEKMAKYHNIPLNDLVRNLFVTKRLLHELGHTIQNFDEVNVANLGILAFVECANSYYVQQIHEDNGLPYLVFGEYEDKQAAAYKELLAEDNETDLKNVFTGNVPRVSVSDTSLFSPRAKARARYQQTKVKVLQFFNEAKVKEIFDAEEF